MSTENPTTPKEEPPEFRADDPWKDTEVRTGVAPEPEVEPATPQDEGKGPEEGKPKSAPSRRVRLAAPIAVAAFAVALAAIVVPALIGDSSPHSRPTHRALPAKAHRPDGQGTGKTRWVREPDASPRPRQGRPMPDAPRGRRRAHPRHESAPAESDVQSQVPAADAAPSESAPEPSSPSAGEPEEDSRLRDGATESEEFGL